MWKTPHASNLAFSTGNTGGNTVTGLTSGKLPDRPTRSFPWVWPVARSA